MRIKNKKIWHVLDSIFNRVKKAVLQLHVRKFQGTLLKITSVVLKPNQNSIHKSSSQAIPLRTSIDFLDIYSSKI